MIDIIEEHKEPSTEPLNPALDEFEEYVRRTLDGIDQADLNQRLTLEARIYGELVQVLDKHGMRTYGLATGVRKYYSYFVVDVIVTEPVPRTIRQIRVPLNKGK